MKIILRKNFETLGQVGQVVDVADGYARNYLIPKQIAYQATTGNLRALDEEKKQHIYREKKELIHAQKLASELEKISITIPMNVGEDDKLFGSVTAQMIADALQEKGMKLDKRIIDFEEPVKALGIYTASVKLHAEVNGKLKVWVVKE
ncbi:MAG: 50S ribosomal protein L9 [Ignavibacteriales bacterium]|nr:50S ribosomal protein L9 [Ignavibacteriales bacterium]